MAAHRHAKAIAEGQLVDVWDMWLRPQLYADSSGTALTSDQMVAVVEKAAELRMLRFAEERGCVPGIMPSSLKGAGWG